MSKTVATIHMNAGRLVVIDSAGALPVAELSDCNMSWDATDKPLPSENQISFYSIRTDQKLTVKAKVQRVLSSRLIAAMTGGTLTSGAANQVVEKESHTAAGTVAATNTTTFVMDLGVTDSSGNAMTPVASAPLVGEYVAGAAGAGSYTFNAGQTGNVYLTYIKSTLLGETVAVTNIPGGASPTIAGYFWSNIKQPDGTTASLLRKFYALVPSKLTEAQKRGDFADSDIELTAIANSSGAFYDTHRVQA